MVIGPESTGKSTLCEQLATHFQTSWCKEFAREYLLTNGKEYRYEDLLVIAKGQLALEDQTVAHAKNGRVFIDTDMYVMKVWSEFVFEKCDPWILNQIANRRYDLYLLCNVDLPWQPDDLREYPDLRARQELYCIYKDHLINQSAPWVEISGSHEQRFEAALNAVNLLTR